MSHYSFCRQATLVFAEPPPKSGSKQESRESVNDDSKKEKKKTAYTKANSKAGEAMHAELRSDGYLTKADFSALTWDSFKTTHPR